MKQNQILNGIFYSPRAVVNLIKQTLKQLKWKYDVIVDNVAGAHIMYEINFKKPYIGIDIAPEFFHTKTNQTIIQFNSLLGCNWRQKLNLSNQKILIATNPQYSYQNSFYQKQLKQSSQLKHCHKSNGKTFVGKCPIYSPT